MSKQPPHNEPELTPDDLRRYRAGLLDAAARHRVERLLLRDPFYDEALAGLEALEKAGQPVAPALADLRNRLHERVGRKASERRLVPGWWAMAASVCLLIGLAVVLYRQPDSPRTVLRRQPIPPGSPSVPPPAAVAPPPELARQGPQAKASRLSGPSLARQEADPALGGGTVPASAPVLPESVNSLRQDVITMAPPGQETAPALQAPPGKQALARSFLQPLAAGQPPRQGRIVDARTGEPLMGVSIHFPGSRQGTATDTSGRFRVPDHLAPDAPLTASYVGYEAKQFSMRDLQAGDLALQENTLALNEVVVLGYGTMRRRSVTGAVTTRQVPYSPGFDAYVRQHKRIPAEADRLGITGRVRLRFKVRKDGSLGRIRVLQGLGHGCDEEALRLLRNGPSWQPATNRRGKPAAGWVEVDITFP